MSDLSEEDLGDDFLGGQVQYIGGGNVKNITGFYIKRLKYYNNELYGFTPQKDKSYNQNYSRRCQNKANYPGWYYKHPIVISLEQKNMIDKHPESKGSYTNYKTDNMGNYYISPEFWDIDRQLPINKYLIYPELKLDNDKLGKLTKLTPGPKYIDELIPFEIIKGPTNKSILQRKNYQWILTKDLKNINKQIYVNDVDTIYHPKKLIMYCCSLKVNESDLRPQKKTNTPTTNPSNSRSISYKIKSQKSTTYIAKKIQGCNIGHKCILIEKLSLFFNQDTDISDNVFLKVGVNQNNFSFINSIFYIINPHIKSNIYEHNYHKFHDKYFNPEEYVTFNNGHLLNYFINTKFTDKQIIKDIMKNAKWTNYRQHIHDDIIPQYVVNLYNSYYNYLEYINNNNTSSTHNIDDIYLSALLEYYLSLIFKKNIGIVIFEYINDTIKIKTPLKGTINKYHDNYIYILKYNELYEPIIYRNIKGKGKGHIETIETIFSNKSNPRIRKTYNDIHTIINEYYDSQINPELNADNTFKTCLGNLHVAQKINPGFRPSQIYIDSNNQIKNIICDNKFILPTNPTGIPTGNNLEQVYVIDNDDCLIYLEYHKMLHELNSILLKSKSSSSNPTTYTIQSINVNNDNKVTQLVINDLYVPTNHHVFIRTRNEYMVKIESDKDYGDIDKQLIIHSNNNNSSESILTINDRFRTSIDKSISIYNNYTQYIFNIIESNIELKTDILNILNNPIMIYNDKIIHLLKIMTIINKKHTIGNDIISGDKNIIYKLLYNMINNGFDIRRLLNIKNIEYSDIITKIKSTELYFTIDNMETKLNNIFSLNQFIKYEQTVEKVRLNKEKSTPMPIIKDNIHYLNKLFNSNYKINQPRYAHIFLIELFINNSHLIDKESNLIINSIYNKTLESILECIIQLKLYMINKLIKLNTLYKETKRSRNKIKNIIRTYYSYYNINTSGSILITHIDKLISLIKTDSNISLIDLMLLNFIFNLNIIIFTLQDDHLIDIFNKTIEHNNGTTINMKTLINDKQNYYIILLHGFHINNVLSTIEIQNKTVLKYDDLPITIKTKIHST